MDLTLGGLSVHFMGVLANTLAVILGSSLGLLFRRGLP